MHACFDPDCVSVVLIREVSIGATSLQTQSFISRSHDSSWLVSETMKLQICHRRIQSCGGKCNDRSVANVLLEHEVRKRWISCFPIRVTSHVLPVCQGTQAYTSCLSGVSVLLIGDSQLFKSFLFFTGMFFVCVFQCAMWE